MGLQAIALALWRAFLSVFYDARCAGCNLACLAALCSDCLETLLPLNAPCLVCAMPNAGLGCTDCAHLKPLFTSTIALTTFQGPARRALLALKYRQRKDLIPLLAARLAAMPDFPEGDWLLVPVPLHRARLRERGFNQAALLARALAHSRGLGWAPVLARPHVTESQQGLSRQARQENMTGAFSCKTDLKGYQVLLVDDVMTTGATAQWAARALLEAGASCVSVMVVARTP
jgi:ComF family protein